MQLKQARRKLTDLINEASRLEDLEDHRDLLPHEWSRLCGLYQEISVMEADLAAHGPLCRGTHG